MVSKIIERDFRPITNAERNIFHRLFELEFPGRDELKAQLKELLAKTIHKDGSILLKVQSNSVFPSECRVPIEARCPDADTKSQVDAHIQILLHVVEGKLFELEIYKEDGSPMIRPPDPTQFKLFSPLLKNW
jgi:hypothetical protein